MAAGSRAAAPWVIIAVLCITAVVMMTVDTGESSVRESSWSESFQAAHKQRSPKKDADALNVEQASPADAAKAVLKHVKEVRMKAAKKATAKKQVKDAAKKQVKVAPQKPKVKATSHAELIKMLLKQQGVDVPEALPEDPQKKLAEKKAEQKRKEHERKKREAGMSDLEKLADQLDAAAPEVTTFAAPEVELPTIPTPAPTVHIVPHKVKKVHKKVQPKKAAPKKAVPSVPEAKPTMFSLNMFAHNTPAPKKKVEAPDSSTSEMLADLGLSKKVVKKQTKKVKKKPIKKKKKAEPKLDKKAQKLANSIMQRAVKNSFAFGGGIAAKQSHIRDELLKRAIGW